MRDDTDRAGPMRAASIRDVATAAGVSMMTVSRAMRGIDGVSVATAARVRALAARMGYVPNGNARAMQAASSRLIGVSVPNLFNDVFADIIGGMRRGLEGAGYSLVIDTTDYDLDRERAWCDRMAAWRPAALVLTGCHHHPGLRADLARLAHPVLELWDVTDDPVDVCVGLDHRAAGAALGAHVARLGYRRPAFVGGPPGLDPRADSRLGGIAEAFDALDRIVVDEPSAFLAGARGAAMLDPAAMPDVVFFHNDNTAFGGMAALAARGLSVPGDIGVVGFNALEIGRVLDRPLTTLATPRRQIGQTAAAHLLARLAGVAPPPRTALPGRLVEGATTRRC